MFNNNVFIEYQDLTEPKVPAENFDNNRKWYMLGQRAHKDDLSFEDNPFNTKRKKTLWAWGWSSQDIE